jgi:flagellar basal body-associated protein FliL
MADDAALEEAPPEVKKREGSILVPIIGAVLVSVLLSVGGTVGALYAMGVFDESGDAVGSVDEEGNPIPSEPMADLGVEVVPLKKFNANLKDRGKKVTLDISLEGRSEDGKSTLEEVVAEKEAAIRDTVLFLLLGFTSADLRGTDGMLRLRDEIHRRINTTLDDTGVTVDRIYFTDAIIP